MTEEQLAIIEKLTSNATIHQFVIGTAYQNVYQQKDSNGNSHYIIEPQDVSEAKAESDEVVYCNEIFKKSGYDIDSRLVELRDCIGACIEGVNLTDKSLFKPNRPQINPSTKCQWYYIFKIIRHSGLLRDNNVPVPKFMNQMMLWYPEVFEKFADDEKRKEFLVQMSKSITDEKRQWTINKQEIPFEKMNSMWDKQNINYDRKFLPMYSVCKELNTMLEAFKNQSAGES